MNPIIRTLALAGSTVLGGVGTGPGADLTLEAGNEQVMDARRETQILASFGVNPRLHAYDLTVLVDGNRVVLGGAVGSEGARDLAAQIATRPGIEQIDNRIRVDPGAVPPTHETADRDAGTLIADAAITASVKSRLRANVHTEELDIRVDTRDGKVTLAGSAISRAQRDAAGMVAGDTDRVAGVNNDLTLSDRPRTVAGTVRAGMRPADSWITSTVESSLLLTRGVAHSGIAVTTRNGVVSLSGVVASEAERELAMRVARDVRGVRQVDADGLASG